MRRIAAVRVRGDGYLRGRAAEMVPAQGLDLFRPVRRTSRNDDDTYATVQRASNIFK